MFNKVAYVALDPGETTGWATFDFEGNAIGMGQFPQSQQTKRLTDLLSPDLKAVVCEDYRNFGWKQQKKWSRNQTSKNIGAIQLLCEMRNIPFHLQQPNIKSIGYLWAGMDGPPTNHAISHQYDAYVHGVYWLQSNGIRKPGIAIPKEDR